MKNLLKILGANLLVLALLLAPLEAAFFILLRRPAWLPAAPRPVSAAVAKLYLNQDKRKLQFMPDCGQYDPQLGYTLKPGSCRFCNREFDTRYEINRFGVRDDEASLHGPDIVVLGDSFAMGWGVRQDETFAQVLERMTGKRVLNTAVASYGTAREVLMLARINPEKPRAVIIQYCGENDFWENANYVENGSFLEAMSPKRYGRVVRDIPKINRWYPGKYLFSWLKTEIHLARTRRPAPDPDKAVDVFLKCLDSRSWLFRGPRLIVLELNEHNHDTGFIPALEKRIRSGQGPDYLKNMTTLDCAAILRQEDFFVLDGHLNATGHAKVARALSRIIENRKPPEPLSGGNPQGA